MKQFYALGTLILIACTPTETVNPDPAPHPVTPAAALLDCARLAGITLVSAHRGGPATGVPDNSLTALRRSALLGAAFAEIDLRWSSDGEIILMHDETLDRTTTGNGPVANHTLAQLQALDLRDAQGRTTGEPVPSLADAFAVSRETGILLQLDPKTVSPVEAAQAASAAGMAERVVVIVQTETDARAVQDVDPQLVVSFAIRSDDALQGTGIDLSRVVSWMGAGIPQAGIEGRLASLGVESSAHDFPAEARRRVDYAAFNRAEVDVLAADNVYAATRVFGRAGDHCPRGAAN